LQGTKLVSNLPEGTSVDHITRAGSNVYFRTESFSQQTGHSVELWVSNGTAAGTRQLHDFGDTDFRQMFGLPNGKVIVGASPTATTGGRYLQPWVSDGTVAGTKLLKDIKADFTRISGSPVFKGVFYFAGSDTTHGNELWRTDGTAAGTFMVQDFI